MNEKLHDRLIESVENEFNLYKNAMLKMTVNDLWISAELLQHTSGCGK